MNERKQRHVPCLIAVIALTVPIAAHAKPKIEVFATGGTIAGAQPSSSEAGYKSGISRIPDAKAKQDPWGGVRSGTTATQTKPNTK